MHARAIAIRIRHIPRNPRFYLTDETNWAWPVVIFAAVPLAGAAAVADLDAAREAVRSRDLDKLARFADRLQGDPLEVYPRYWPLSAQIDTVGDAPIRNFLQTFPGSLLAERLRSDWLKALGKAERWDVFAAERCWSIRMPSWSVTSCAPGRPGQSRRR